MGVSLQWAPSTPDTNISHASKHVRVPISHNVLKRTPCGVRQSGLRIEREREIDRANKRGSLVTSVQNQKPHSEEFEQL